MKKYIWLIAMIVLVISITYAQDIVPAIKQPMGKRWLFYGIGYLGLVMHIIAGALKLGKSSGIGPRVEALGLYFKANSLAVLGTFIAYNTLIALWIWSSALEFFGAMEGVLNGSTIPLAYMANSIFATAVSMKAKAGNVTIKEDETP